MTGQQLQKSLIDIAKDPVFNITELFYQMRADIDLHRGHHMASKIGRTIDIGCGLAYKNNDGEGFHRRGKGRPLFPFGGYT